MHPISSLRYSEDSHHFDETSHLRAMSIQESVRQWLELQAAFEWQLQQTAHLFEEDRRKALAELQARLHCLVD
jgi:hypothetical protein